MRIRKSQGEIRSGAAAVEFAFVAIILFMLLFGILEYSRLLFMLHLTNNAARDTARYAVVHTGGGTVAGDPTTISKEDLIQLVKTGKIGTREIGPGLAGMERNLDNLQVDVFFVDATGLAQNPAVANPDPRTGVSWNSAPFSQRIAVRIKGDYKPVLPNLLMLNSTIPLQVTVSMSSEAN